MNNEPHRNVANLGTAEVFVLWSVRVRFERGPDSPSLIKGYRQIFGLSRLEHALAYFEIAFNTLMRHRTCYLELLSPSCRRLSRGEVLLLHLAASVQSARIEFSRKTASILVGSKRADALCGNLTRYVAILCDKELLPLRVDEQAGFLDRSG